MATVSDILTEPMLIGIIVLILVGFFVNLWLKSRKYNRNNKVHHRDIHDDIINNKVDSILEEKNGHKLG